MPEYTAEAITGHDPLIIQRLLADGETIGTQVNLRNTWNGNRIDLGTTVDPAILGLTVGKRVQVAFGEMESFSVGLLSVEEDRYLVVDGFLGQPVPAGDVLWILDEDTVEEDLPPLPPVIPTIATPAPFQLGGDGEGPGGGGLDAGYGKGDLGMSRLINREEKYGGPGDLSELPAPMKTGDKVPTAHGWQWPRTSKLFFDETEGTEYILLEDIDGNYDRMDTPSGTRTKYQKKRIVMIVPKSGIEIHIMCPFLHTESYGDTQMDVGRDLLVNVEGDAVVKVKGDAIIDVKGNVTATVGKNLDAIVKGDVTIDVKKTLLAKVQSNATLRCNGMVTIKGKQVLIN